MSDSQFVQMKAGLQAVLEDGTWYSTQAIFAFACEHYNCGWRDVSRAMREFPNHEIRLRTRRGAKYRLHPGTPARRRQA